MGMLEIFRISGRIACEYSDAQRGIEAVSRTADNVAQRIENMGDEMQSAQGSMEGLGESTEETQDRVEGLGRSTEDTTKETEKAEGKTKKFSKALSALGNVAGKVGTVMTGVAKGVGLAMTAVGTGVLAAGKAATDVGKTFESSVSQIAATMGKSVKEIDGLKEKAKEMGATTQFSASQAAEGLNILAMSGLEAEEQMVSIDKVLNLAAAGSLSLESAASYATGAVKGFGDEMGNMQYYTDLMAKGATLANTNVEGLGQALSASSATANSYKQGADSVTLSLLRLAEQNVTGEAAATSLNRAMADLYTPTEVAKQALDKLGISAYDSEGNTRDFNVVVDEMNEKLKDMTAEEANAYKAAIFTTNGLNAFNKMTASSAEKVEDFRKGLAEASDGEGSAAEQAKTMIDNLEGDITLLQSAAEGLGITFYETFNDDLRSSVQFATDSLGKLTEAFENNGLEGAADVAGTIISDIANKAVEYAPILIETVTTLIDSISNALSENSGNIAQSAGKLITSIANGLTSNTSTILTATVNILHNVLGELPSIIGGLINSAGNFTSTIINFLTSSSSEIINFLPNIITKILNGLNNTLSAFIPSLISSVSNLIDALTSNLPKILKSITEELPQILKRILNNLKNNLPQFIESILNMAEILLANLSSILSNSIPELIALITDFLPEIINNIVNVIFENLPILLEGVSMLVMGIVNALPSMIENIIGMIPVILTGIAAALSNSFPSVVQAVGGLILKLAGALPDLIASLLHVIPELINSIIVSLAGFLPVFIDTGIQLFTSLIAAVPVIINAIADSLPQIIDSVINGLLSSLPQLLDCVIEIVFAIADNLPDIAYEIIKAFPLIFEHLAEALIALTPRIFTVVGDIIWAVADYLPKGAEKLVECSDKVGKSIINKFKSFVSDFVNIGKNLVEGIWEGILGAGDWISDKVTGWCETLEGSFADFFGIHSPSTLFHDKIGSNLAFGIGEGFEDTMPDVSKDMQEAMPTAFDIDPGLNLVSGDSRMQTLNNTPVSSLTAQPVQSGGVINFTLQIDNFNNTANTSVNDLSETITTTLYELIRRNKLAVI